VAGIVVAGTAAALTGRAIGARHAYAEVITSNPVYASVRVPYEDCGVAPSRRAAESSEKRCVAAYRLERKQIGWDVRYRVRETLSVVRLDTNPGVGARLPVRDGRVVFTVQTGAQDP
jgi:uncharacterized protein YcfJ